MRLIVCVGVLSAICTAVPAQAEPSEEQRVLAEVLTRYHAALSAGESEQAAATLGPSLFMADDRTGGGAERTSAHLFLAGDELVAWPAAYLAEVAPHQNEFRILSVSVRGDAAVIRTSDTGRNKFREWKEEEVTWFLGRVAEDWKIIGMVISDIQLPPREP